jgi:hypothetical protein
VGEPGPRSVRRRAAAFAAVTALHAVLVITLGVALRTAARRSSAAQVISTFILLPAPTVRTPPPEKQRPSPFSERAPLETVGPPAVLPPEISLPIAPEASIDWGAEAGRAAAAMTEAKKFRDFGHHGSAESAPQSRGPAHQAGEQYRLETGEWIVWVNERCYIISGVPPLGMPDVIARSIPTRTVCQGDSAPRGDLFKELPAYQRYHH